MTEESRRCMVRLLYPDSLISLHVGSPMRRAFVDLSHRSYVNISKRLNRSGRRKKNNSPRDKGLRHVQPNQSSEYELLNIGVS